MSQDTPQAGGSYIRQNDGTLKRADAIDKPAAPAAATTPAPKRPKGEANA